MAPHCPDGSQSVSVLCCIWLHSLHRHSVLHRSTVLGTDRTLSHHCSHVHHSSSHCWDNNGCKLVREVFCFYCTFLFFSWAVALALQTFYFTTPHSTSLLLTYLYLFHLTHHMHFLCL